MLILIGKSGSGKTAVVNELVKRGSWKKAVTYTTRPIRPGEVNGVDYNFVSQEEFDRLKANDFFAETTAYDASFGHCEYGSAVKDYQEYGDNIVMILNPHGLNAVRKYMKAHPHSGMEIHPVYLKASEDVLLKRLDKRGDSKEEVLRRLKTDRTDFMMLSTEYFIPVDKLSVEEVADEIEKHFETGKFKPEEDYCPCSTYGDYGPSNPWDAPGMSIHDFI